MEREQNEIPQENESAYTPRPMWQVWLARVGLAAFIVFLIYYYITIFGGGA